MKSFKKFVAEAKKKPPILIPVDPVHGSHSRAKIDPKLIPFDPVHGAHSRPRVKLKEDLGFHIAKKQAPKVHSADDWDMDRHHDNHHLGNHYEEVHDKINMSYDEYRNLPDHHREAIRKYTGFSHDTNHELLAKAKGEPSTLSHPEDKIDHEEHVAHLDETISHHRLKHDISVYHGTSKFNPGELASKHPERKIKSAAYLSTTIRPSKAYNFTNRVGGEKRDYAPAGGHILHIHLKKGQRALYAGSHSEFRSEYEAILPRDTTLKIHHKPDLLSDGTHIWHAHVVDDK